MFWILIILEPFFFFFVFGIRTGSHCLEDMVVPSQL